MPTYEYVCQACGHTFDDLQSFSDEPLKKCPACKKNKLQRSFGTGAAIIFKGSGFYETDYRSESYKKAAKADQEAAGKTAGDTGTTGSTGTNGASAAASGANAPKDGAKSSKSPT